MKPKINIWGAAAKEVSEYFANTRDIKSVNRAVNYVRSTTEIQVEYKTYVTFKKNSGYDL